MTVDELALRLQFMQKEGNGKAPIVVEWEVDGVMQRELVTDCSRYGNCNYTSKGQKHVATVLSLWSDYIPCS